MYPYPPELSHINLEYPEEIELQAIKGTFSVDKAWNLRDEQSKTDFLKGVFNIIPQKEQSNPYIQTPVVNSPAKKQKMDTGYKIEITPPA
jgi:hypothetical protein